VDSGYTCFEVPAGATRSCRNRRKILASVAPVRTTRTSCRRSGWSGTFRSLGCWARSITTAASSGGNQSARIQSLLPACTVTFSGKLERSGCRLAHVGGSAIGQDGVRADRTIAKQSRGTSPTSSTRSSRRLGLVAGSVLTITSHSFGSVWQYHVYTELPASNTGSGHATVTGDLRGGSYGVKWVIDPTQTPVPQSGFPRLEQLTSCLLKANGMSAFARSRRIGEPTRHPPPRSGSSASRDGQPSRNRTWPSAR